MTITTKPSSRRWFLASLAFAPVAVAIAGRGQARAQETAAPAAGSAPVCELDDPTRQSFNYVDLSPHGSAKDCRNCEFWVPEEAGQACGGCTLMSGPFSPVGYCDVWALAGDIADQGGVAAAGG